VARRLHRRPAGEHLPRRRREGVPARHHGRDAAGEPSACRTP
jgi:hypothetical protein